MADVAATAPATAPAVPAQAPATPAAAPAVAAQAAAATEATAAAVDNAAPKAGESTQDFELRLSKLTREARIAREAEGRLKAANTAMAKELEAARAELGKAKNKRMTRSQYIEMSKAMASDPEKVREFLDDDSQQLSPELRERMEKLEAKLRERDEEDAKRATDGTRQRELSYVAGDLAKWSEDMPMFAGNEVVAEHLLDLWHQEWKEMGATQESKPDLRELAETLHGNIVKNLANAVDHALKSTKARQYLVKAIPGLGALLKEHEAQAGGPESDAQGAAAANGRGSSSNPASRPDPKTLTEEQAKALRVAALEEARTAWRANKAQG